MMQFNQSAKKCGIDPLQMYPVLHTPFMPCWTLVSLGSNLWVRLSQTDKLSETRFANLSDVTLAGEDTNSIQ